MKANYHTHTHRCNHAIGTEEEYITHAIARGLDTLGFSDHTPYFFIGDYYSRFRMRPEQLSSYVNTLTALKQKYSNQLQLHIGLEAEYYPAFFRELRAFLRDYPLEYMILGQHFIGDEPHGVYSGTPTVDRDLLKQYCRQVMDAMQTGLFTYFAHPDIVNFTGSERLFRECLREVVREAKSCRVPLEINLLGLMEGRQYPSRRLLEIAAEESCPMILGCDAHEPEALSDLTWEKAALELAGEYGISVLERVELKPVN